MQPKISFILYKPGVAGNIGATARAMKTMGFSDLRLIDPVYHLSDEAKMMAHGSLDILENCTLFDSFEEAVRDLDLIIGTTANTNKNAKVDYIPSSELTDFIRNKGNMIKTVGIVFGTEESGLPGEVLRETNTGLTIPASVHYPSLNLSQAVMVIAYELFKNRSDENKIIEKHQHQQHQQPEASWKDLQDKTDQILNKINIKPPTPLYHRIIERMSFLKASDARLVHSVSSKILKYFT